MAKRKTQSKTPRIKSSFVVPGTNPREMLGEIQDLQEMSFKLLQLSFLVVESLRRVKKDLLTVLLLDCMELDWLQLQH